MAGRSGPQRSDRRLAAVLAADVAGYSRLMGADEDGTVRAWKAHLGAILPLVADFGGEIINLAGDGVLAEFPSAVRAMQCAADIQQTMAMRNQGLDSSSRMELRIGINLGDIIRHLCNRVPPKCRVCQRA